MKHYFISLILVFYSIYVCCGEDSKQAGKNRGEALAIETNSELVSSGENIQTVHKQSAVQCSKDGSKCLTCKSVGMCKGGVMMEVPCRGLYPYCDARTGSCTNERKRCKEEEKPMVCPGKGYFPDPQSCRAFHVCEGDPIKSYKFACASLQVYDHEEKKCTRPSFRVRCVSFSCFGKQGRYTPYPSDRSVYTLCADAAATEIFKCSENEEFDETKQKCVPSCKSEDNMPDKDDETCRKYYRCVKSGRKIDPVPSTCPSQRVFDEVQLKCVDKSADFKCANIKHQEISSSPSSLTTTETGQKEESIVETEETFFRQNPSHGDKNDHLGKSASIIGSVLHKEVENYQSPSMKVTKGPSSTNDKTNPPVEKKTFQSVQAGPHSVQSTLNSMNQNVADLQPIKQIVVREANTDRPSNLNSYSSTSTRQTYQVTTEESTKTSPHHEIETHSNIVDNRPHSNEKGSVQSTNANNKATIPTLNEQTYKITTDFHSITESYDKVSPVSTKLMINHDSTLNQDDHLPIQVFNINKDNVNIASDSPQATSNNRQTSTQSTDRVTQVSKSSSHQF